jgi:hypothetical protein
MSLLLLLTQPRNVVLAAGANSFAVTGAGAFAVAVPADAAAYSLASSGAVFAATEPAAAASYTITGAANFDATASATVIYPVFQPTDTNRCGHWRPIRGRFYGVEYDNEFLGAWDED